MAVTNVFGERIWVDAAGRGDDEDWQRWGLFLSSIKGDVVPYVVDHQFVSGSPAPELFARAPALGCCPPAPESGWPCRQCPGSVLG